MLMRGQVGSGPEIKKKPDWVSGDFGGPDIRYIGGSGISGFGFSGIGIFGSGFGAPDFDIIF